MTYCIHINDRKADFSDLNALSKHIGARIQSFTLELKEGEAVMRMCVSDYKVPDIRVLEESQ